jgi:hypothetical protein
VLHPLSRVGCVLWIAAVAAVALIVWRMLLS